MDKERLPVLKNHQEIDFETLSIETLIQPQNWLKITGENPEESQLQVIIPTHDEEAIIGRTLESLIVQKIPDSSSLTVDVISNGTTDNTEEEVKKAQESLCQRQAEGLINTGIRVRLFCLEESNKAAALNFGRRHALSDILINMDADTFPSANAIAKIYALMKSDPHCMAASIMPKRLNDNRGPRVLRGMQDFYNAFMRENGAILGRFFAYKPEFFGEFPEDIMSDDTWLEFISIDRYGSDSVRFLGQSQDSDVAVFNNSITSFTEFVGQLLRWESSFRHLMRKYPELEEACHLANRVKYPKEFISLIQTLKQRYPDISFRDKLLMYHLLTLVRQITRIQLISEKLGNRATWTSPRTNREV